MRTNFTYIIHTYIHTLPMCGEVFGFDEQGESLSRLEAMHLQDGPFDRAGELIQHSDEQHEYALLPDDRHHSITEVVVVVVVVVS